MYIQVVVILYLKILDNECTRVENPSITCKLSSEVISHIYSQSIFAYILPRWQIADSLEHSRPCINIPSSWQKKKKKKKKRKKRKTPKASESLLKFGSFTPIPSDLISKRLRCSKALDQRVKSIPPSNKNLLTLHQTCTHTHTHTHSIDSRELRVRNFV